MRSRIRSPRANRWSPDSQRTPSTSATSPGPRRRLVNSEQSARSIAAGRPCSGCPIRRYERLRSIGRRRVRQRIMNNLCKQSPRDPGFETSAYSGVRRARSPRGLADPGHEPAGRGGRVNRAVVAISGTPFWRCRSRVFPPPHALPAQCSPACAPRGRLSSEQPARSAGRWEILAAGRLSACASS